MPRFLIKVTHGADQTTCIKALQAIDRYGSHLLTNAEWGCQDGTHTGWLIGEFESREQALQVVPPDFRKDCTIVEVVRFTREYIASVVASVEE